MYDQASLSLVSSHEISNSTIDQPPEASPKRMIRSEDHDARTDES